MAFRYFTRNLFHSVKILHIQPRLLSTVRCQPSLFPKSQQTSAFRSIRSFSSVQTNDNAYRDLETFLQKEVQLEKSAQKHPNKLPKIGNFEANTNGPEVTLTNQSGNDKVTVKLNIANSVNASESESEADLNPAEQEQQTNNTQLKSRPNFTVEINRSGQILSFLCSFLPNDYPEGENQYQDTNKGHKTQGDQEQLSEDFQIDEFTIHEGEWNDKVYSSDCSVIDGELYDKLLNLLEEHGIGEEFANQLVDFSTAYEHRQYINLLEKLQQFVKN